MKIHKGDTVQVITGKDAGKTGKVESVNTKTELILVPELNTYKRHVKKSEMYPQGGVVQIARPYAASKLMLVCPKCNKSTRVGYTITPGSKNRICKKCQAVI